MSKTVVFDFDGVIHSYTSGWQGIENIPDPPVDGIEEILRHVKEDLNCEVVIVSTRSYEFIARNAMWTWLCKYHLNMYVDDIVAKKPPAMCYVDDRAVRFKPDELDRVVDEIDYFVEGGR